MEVLLSSETDKKDATRLCFFLFFFFILYENPITVRKTFVDRRSFRLSPTDVVLIVKLTSITEHPVSRVSRNRTYQGRNRESWEMVMRERERE